MNCRHDVCTCMTADGEEYCSPGCRSESLMDGCPCGHQDCAASSVNAEAPLT